MDIYQLKTQIENSSLKFQKSHIVQQTPLQKSERLSKKYQCQLFFKREDLQSGEFSQFFIDSVQIPVDN